LSPILLCAILVSNREMVTRKDITQIGAADKKILKYLKEMGPEYPWLLSVRINTPYKEAKQGLENLNRKGLIQRVEGRIVEYRHNRRLKNTKHRNHTYYDLTRLGKLILRDIERYEDIDLNLKLQYKR